MTSTAVSGRKLYQNKFEESIDVAGEDKEKHGIRDEH
jgi:hypothetical protein